MSYKKGKCDEFGCEKVPLEGEYCEKHTEDSTNRSNED